MSKLGRRTLDTVAWAVTRTLFRVDVQGLDRIPHQGPFILISNHVTGFELPVLRTVLRPRTVRALAKAESWDHRWLGWTLDQWGAIPIRRGEPDAGALRAALQVLRDGGMLGIMPEGTRSHDGVLQRGNPGIALLALKSDCPIIPMAFWGVERVRRNARKCRRTPFHLRVGEAFSLPQSSERSTRENRQQLADHVMTQVAALLPEAYRGVYRDLVTD